MTTKLRKYVVKRTNATRLDPKAEPTVLGFMDGPGLFEANQLALAKWGNGDEYQILYLTPVSRATAADLVLASEVQADAYYGPSWGKRRRVVCVCGSACYFHPKQPRDKCLYCGKPLTGHPDLLVDMAREVRSWAVEKKGN